MEEEKILSVVFPVELIISNAEPLAVIRHGNGQALRLCHPNTLTEAFKDIIDNLQKYLNAPFAAGKAVE